MLKCTEGPVMPDARHCSYNCNARGKSAAANAALASVKRACASAGCACAATLNATASSSSIQPLMLRLGIRSFGRFRRLLGWAFAPRVLGTFLGFLGNLLAICATLL